MKPVGGLTLDAGALIAVDRNKRSIRILLNNAERNGIPVVIPAAALAQAWRGGPKQALLSKLVSSAPVQVVPLDEDTAKVVGVLCGRAGHSDVVDASVALCARLGGHAVVTSDPGDMAKLDPKLRLIAV